LDYWNVCENIDSMFQKSPLLSPWAARLLGKTSGFRAAGLPKTSEFTIYTEVPQFHRSKIPARAARGREASSAA
jgi:hypothetical protein